ncbi:hypothetical protein [Saccharopolyspora spinosa]|uniref:Uncharacterized protein n=2 Tax=Saccharopolyspora spinosa TaxID=60894 RepID=A0A2N3Y0K0_SACSN|nr:hypothetical protein A8926_4280 [Saccharopolyspora spinosa]
MFMPPVEVFAAIESAAEARSMLEQADLGDPAQRDWMHYEVALLAHWAALVTKAGEYTALGEGLADFAARCEHLLDSAARCGKPGQ